MPIDINLIRAEKGGDPAKVIESEKKRGKTGENVRILIEVDKKWREERFKLDKLKERFNKLNEEIKKKKIESKGKEKCEEEVKLRKEVCVEIEEQERVESEKGEEVRKRLRDIGNVLHESVVSSLDEKDNQVVKQYGEINKDWEIDGTLGNLHHNEVLRLIDGYDPERGQNLAGHRGFFLKGYGVLLNQALINHGINFLMKKDYTLLQPPLFMKKSIMSHSCQLEEFDAELYKVTTAAKERKAEAQEEEKKTGKGAPIDKEPCYLIATSEQPISAFHMKEWLKDKQLPKRYGGLSTCFRKEAGAHGKDVWGIFRVHQFEKVEQFCITNPDKSWEMQEEMMNAAEEFFQTFKIPYRVVNIVSGEINDACSKKYDLEAWFPGYKDYRELVSCSNCTDYQSRGLEIRFGNKTAEGDKRYVHMLNATLCATERTMCCILENYQTETGLKVPAALIPYLGGVNFIQFKEEIVQKFLKEKEKEKQEFILKEEREKAKKEKARKAKELKEAKLAQKQAEDALKKETDQKIQDKTE